MNTDHLPIIYELDVRPITVEHEPRPMWRKTEWDALRADLFIELCGVPRLEEHATREEVDAAILALGDAMWTAARKHVQMSKPSPYSKRWWNADLTELKKVSQRHRNISYRHRMQLEHPAHVEAREHREAYATGVMVSKVDLVAGRLASGSPSDGGRARVPTLKGERDPVTRAPREIVSNEDKSAAFYKEFFPPRMHTFGPAEPHIP